MQESHKEKLHNIYVVGMQSESTWATDAEIFSMASFIKTDIAVFAIHGLKKQWIIYTASLLNGYSSDAIMLQHSFGNHFDVLVNLQ